MFFCKRFDLDAQVRLQKIEKKQHPEVDQISNLLRSVILYDHHTLAFYHTPSHMTTYIFYRCHDFHLQACRADRRSLSITVAMAMKQLVQQTLAVWHTPHSCRIKSPWQFFNLFPLLWVVSTYPCRPWFLGVVMCIAGTLGLLRLLGQTPRWTKLGMVILKPGKIGEGVDVWVDAFMRCECLCRYSFKGPSHFIVQFLSWLQ